MRLSEAEINVRVSLCSFPALMALHDSTAIENEIIKANRRCESSVVTNTSEPMSSRNSGSIKKKIEHGSNILHKNNKEFKA